MIGPHVVIEGPTRIGRDNRISPVRLARRGAAGQEVRRRAHRTGHRRPQPDPRIRHLQPRHRRRRRRHAHRQRQLDHGLRAHRARLPGRQPRGVRQLRRRWPAMCEVGDWAVIGGFAGVHQFCKIGAHAFIGMGCLVGADVPPFVTMADEQRGRRAASTAKASSAAASTAARITAIKRAYRTLYMAARFRRISGPACPRSWLLRSQRSSTRSEKPEP